MSYHYVAQQPYSVVPATVQPYAVQAPAYDQGGYAAPPQQYHQAPAPQAYAMAPQQTQAYGRDEPRTIFVTGFPPDVHERELKNMCRFMPGFEAAAMKSSNTYGAPQGFVLFSYGQQAHQALNLINGVEFGDGFRLRAEMARKNMYVRAGEERPAKTYRTDNGPMPGHSPTSNPVDRTADNPPCDTLFIGNLSQNITEADVEAYFRNLMGDRFTACKLSRSGGNRVSAFVQFVDIPTAQEVHTSQQGKELPGSDRGPMRIQFSKNQLGEFGKRRREEERAAAAAAAAGASPNGGASYNASPVHQHLQTLNNIAAQGPGQPAMGAPGAAPPAASGPAAVAQAVPVQYNPMQAQVPLEQQVVQPPQ